MKSLKLLLPLVILLASCEPKEPVCIPYDLKCEYLVNPIGVDVNQPRLLWKIRDKRFGAAQQGYKIVMGTDSAAVKKGIGDQWNSVQENNTNMLIRYQGKPLLAHTKYYWNVQVWDKNGKLGKRSPLASFETGLMGQSNWKGSWISDSRDENLKPAAYFRKEFTSEKKIKSARAYVAVAGLFECSINGKQVGDHRLDPNYTRFDRRTAYLSYDVTHLIQQGVNALGVLLGNGWYNHQSTAVWYFHEAPWRARPKFCLDLRLEYEDGTLETISTDRSWKTALSPVVFNSIYTAEHYDARLEQAGWNTAGFDDSKWRSSFITSAPSQNIVSQQLQPIRDVERIHPAGMKKLDSKTYLFDLGRNISGVSQIQIQGERGTVLRLKHSELLDSLGHADQSNIDIHYRPTDDTDPFQTDLYILKGEGLETFSPRFNYKGFQYVEISADRDIELNENSLVGIFMHSDVPPIGQISSSSTTLNKIWTATNNSYLSNLFGYPTDCPQREKNGWTGDAHIAVETGLFNFDGITVYEKWMADHRDEQQPNGILPSIIPSSGWGYDWGNGPDWTSTIALIPWNIYLFYGDQQLLEDCYDNIRRYVDHISAISTDYLTDWGLGDWVPVKSLTPVAFTSSIYYYVDVTILSKAAKLLGKESDYEKYSSLATKIKRSFNDTYLHPGRGIYNEGTQTELSTALHWGLVPDSLQQKVADQLAKRVLADGSHIDVGLLGTKAILNALSDHGYADLAYTLAAQEDFPSWGWWIANGATTLMENWDLNRSSDLSRNHIMFGEIGAWYYKALGGIHPDPENPGFKKIILKPNFVKGLDRFEARHTGPYGEIISAWSRSGDEINYRVVIPPNSSGTLSLKVASINNSNNSGKHYILSEDVLTGSKAIYLESGVFEFVIRE